MDTHVQDIETKNSAIARERVMADLKCLVRDAEALLHATSGDVSDKAKEARLRVAAALDRAKATCDEVQELTLEKAKAAARQADTVIRQHPYESIGIAFGIGLLIGVLVVRK